MHGAEVPPTTPGPPVTCSWRSGSTASSTRRRRSGDQQPGEAGYCRLRLLTAGVGLDGAIELEALRLYGLPEGAPALLCGTPLLSGPLSGSGRREFAAEVSWDLPSLAAGATAMLDVTITGARVGDLAQASLATSSRFFELDATAWSNNTVRMLARNVSNTTIDVGPATLSLQVTNLRVSSQCRLAPEGADHAGGRTQSSTGPKHP